jgi:long-chain acyl-CoA synthetase
MSERDFDTLNLLFLKAIDRYDKPDAFLHKVKGAYQAVSSREVLRQVGALARGLTGLGVGPGDRVALLSENRLEWALTDYAVLGLGGIVVPIFPTLLEGDTDYILRDSGAMGVVLSSETQLRKVLNTAAVSGLRFILAMDRTAAAAGSTRPAPALRAWHEVLGRALEEGGDVEGAFRERASKVKPGDTASILYTSGSTGQPKGVVLTHANIASNVGACAGLLAFEQGDVALSFLPLSHIYERMLDYLYLWRGVTIAYAESLETLPQNILEVRPTEMAVVPRLLERIHARVLEAVQQSSPLKQKLFQWAFSIGREYFPYQLAGRTPPGWLRLRHAFADTLVLSKVRARLGGRMRSIICGSAPLSRELAEFFWSAGLPVYEGYGLTETSPVISTNYPGRVKLGTVGPPIPGCEVKMGEESTDFEGRTGREILVRGPNVTPGYYHLEEENRRAFTDGWFHTGDLGELDADGFLRVTGRKKNLFKTSGGKYVAPEKLENLFQGHPYVAQVMVLGEGRKFVSALIVPHFNRLEAYAREHAIPFQSRQELVRRPEIQRFLQEQVDELNRDLPPYEKIRQIAILPEEFSINSGELSATLKIKRWVVEAKYRDLIEEIYRRPAPEKECAAIA